MATSPMFSVEKGREALSAYGTPPSVDAVHGQTIKGSVSQWEKRLNDARDRGINLPQTDISGIESLSRQDIFDLNVDLNDPASVLSFYVHVCSWGSGRSQVERRFRALTQPDALTRIAAALGAATAQEQYREFNNGDRNKVKYLGPAFFTKLMYFYANQNSVENNGALILDKFVALALGASKTGGWKTDRYMEYLDVVAQLRAGDWSSAVPDAIEYALFQRGKH